jgi:hypothetical protein
MRRLPGAPIVSRLAQIVTFLRLADDGLSVRVLAATIRHRWPEATRQDVREALAEAARGLPDDVDERAAMDVGAAGILGRRG